MDAIVGTAGSFKYESRSDRLKRELQYALRSVSREELASCFRAVPQDVLRAFKRRGVALYQIGKRGAQTIASEVSEMIQAGKRGKGREHLQARYAHFKESASRKAQDLRHALRRTPQLLQAVRSDPSAVLPEVVGSVLGFAIGSGGLDANGGIPDLDLMFGIGAHRSLLTHTILVGVGAECVGISLARLIHLVYDKLPPDHDPVWDSLHEQTQRTITAARVGTALGLGFHLLADGTVQVGALHGLPVELPMEAHQTIITTSGAAEAAVGVKGFKRRVVGAFKRIPRRNSN
ncbi:MAG: hypothetical protein D6724_02615 [Armatimonadetes bacterium]|nr:MAG: hypothetical protein D6724_02615 [Armatimonadota bacterium]